MKQLLRIGLLSVFVLLCGLSIARATVIYESAALGPDGQTTAGFSLNSDQFLGARFHVDSTVHVAGIGGHLYGSGGMFGAIFALATPSAFPSGPSLASTATFDPGYPSSDVTVPLSVTLSPGDYAVVFGCVDIGSLYHCGGMPKNNADVAGVSRMFWNGAIWQDNALAGTRFVVSAVPEPATWIQIAVGLSLLALGVRRMTMSRNLLKA